MSYLGNTPTTQSFISGTDYFNGTGAQTAFTLSRTVNSVNDIEVFVNNVAQRPNNAYTISGTTLTFDQAPSVGTQNIYVRYLSTTTQTITPSQNTVSYASWNSDLQTETWAFRNRIINGAMMIDQRNAGASVANADGYIVDRWNTTWFGSGAGRWTAQRSTTAPAGFINSFQLTVTATDSSPASTSAYLIRQIIEGLNVADLGWGTANAQTVTVSFWVRSSVTGTYSVVINNNDGNRAYASSYTINSANTFEYKTITIPGDTTGTWSNTNTGSIQVIFGLGGGSGRTINTGSWQTVSATTTCATGQTNWIGNSGATFYITGVQLEKGSTATSFDYRPYGTELALCQRYCPVFDAATGTGARILGYGRSNTATDVSFSFPVTLRTPPTGITVSSSSHFSIFNPLNGGIGSVTSLTFNLGDIQGAICQAATTVGSPTIASGALLQMFPNSTSAKIIFNGCEL